MIQRVLRVINGRILQQDMQTDADPISDDAVRSLLLFSQPPNSDYGPPPPPEPKKVRLSAEQRSSGGICRQD